MRGIRQREKFREFGGKMYVFNETVLTKAEAKKKARLYRKEGMLVRIIPVVNGYDLFWISGR
jgi:hypothetical protein